MTKYSPYPAGTIVELSNGKNYEVAKYNRGWYTSTSGEKFRPNQVTDFELPENFEYPTEDTGKPKETLSDIDEGEHSDIEDEDEDEDEDDHNVMSQTLSKYSKHYHPSRSYSGRKSLIAGDELSTLLVSFAPEDVIRIAEIILGLEEGELALKYCHLNKGQKRMSAGNRLRAALKREDITTEDIKKVCKSHLFKPH